MAAAQTSGAHAVVETLHEEGSGEDDEDGDAEQGYAFDGFDNDLEEVAWEDWEALEAEADEGDLCTRTFLFRWQRTPRSTYSRT